MDKDDVEEFLHATADGDLNQTEILAAIDAGSFLIPVALNQDEGSGMARGIAREARQCPDPSLRPTVRIAQLFR